MPVRFPRLAVLALAVSLPLGACSSEWDYLTSFGSPASDDEDVVAEAPPAPSQAASAPRQVASAAAPAAPAPAAPAMDPWCSQVMTADVAMAQRNGLDQATQQRMAVASYRQCLAIFASSAPN